jgi:hypothetical protein
MKAEDLFALSPSEFTQARNRLVRELRERGDAAGARALEKLRKPGWPLYAVNQLARRHAREVDALLEAAASLTRTHRRVLEGKASATDLRAASERHKQALSALEKRAAEELGAAGAGAGVLRRVRTTLHAASIGDQAVRDRLIAGTLEHELEPPDLLAGTEGISPRPRPRGGKPPAPTAAERREAERAERAEQRRRETEARARAKQVARAEKLEARAVALEEQARALREEAKRLRR